MKYIKIFEQVVNEGKIGDKLTALFTKQTGFKLNDDVKDSEYPGKWTVTRLWAPQDTGGMNPGLNLASLPAIFNLIACL